MRSELAGLYGLGQDAPVRSKGVYFEVESKGGCRQTFQTANKNWFKEGHKGNVEKWGGSSTNASMAV